MKLAYLVENTYLDEEVEELMPFEERFTFTLREPDKWRNYKTIVWDYVDED